MYCAAVSFLLVIANYIIYLRYRSFYTSPPVSFTWLTIYESQLESHYALLRSYFPTAAQVVLWAA